MLYSRWVPLTSCLAFQELKSRHFSVDYILES